jgi:DNA-binding transcriptional regulator YdaS (Cro superfamily)
MANHDAPRDAPTLLAVWMAKRKQTDRGLSWKTFAGRLGCSANGLSFWLNRRRRPNRRFANAIERETGGEVPASAWDDEPPGVAA